MKESPSKFNLLDYFLNPARLARLGHRTAIEFRHKRLTYNDLRGEVDYWARKITDSGITQSDRVALALLDSPELIASFLATVSVGAIAVPINTFLSRDEIQFIIADCDAQLVITESELAPKANALSTGDKFSVMFVDTHARPCFELEREAYGSQSQTETTGESPAFLLYTSGSTGAPKGALHLHGAIPVTVENYSDSILRLTEEDRLYSSSRLFFAYGLGNSLSFPLAAGATVILDSERPTPERLARIFAERRPSVFFGVPALYRALLDYNGSGERLDLSSVRLCVSAGEALPAKIFEDWRREFGLEILDGIGSTEMLHIFISNRAGEARGGSSGRIVEGYEARLVGDNGGEVGVDEAGKLWVKGASAMAGYWNREELTRATIRDGWVRTGDVYRRDAEEFFYHVGRSDDCFKVRGLWVSPVEIESVLLTHKAVADAAVVAAKDEQGLATARAYLVIRNAEGSEELKRELRDFAAARLPQYKVPAQIEFINEMPRTSTGKIQRYRLRAAAQQRGSEG